MRSGDRVLLWVEGHMDGQHLLLICCRDLPAHLFYQGLADGEPQAAGMPGGFHGEEAVEEPPHLDLIQRRRGVGEGDGAAVGEGDAQVSGTVLEGVAEDIAIDPGQSLSVELPQHPLL